MKKVPIPKAAAPRTRLNHTSKQKISCIIENLTIETKLVTLLFERDCLFDVEPIRVHDHLLAEVDAQLLVRFFGLRSKDERVAGVLPQAVPTAGAIHVSGKVLFTECNAAANKGEFEWGR